MMVTIGWSMLLLVLILSLRLGGVSLGLLSVLALGVLTFSIQPAAPPNDLMLLQATWLLLMATLEAAGLFYLLATKFRACITQTNRHYGLLIALFCYGLVFLTGDAIWLDRLGYEQDELHNHKPRLLVPMGIAAHMALLASPLSIVGIPLIVVSGNSGCATLDLVGTIVAITVSITVASSLLAAFIPNRWLLGLKASTKNAPETATPSKGKFSLTLLLLLLTAMLFLLIKPEANGCTRLSWKIFPVRFPIFFALVMLSLAAVAMLGCKVKPAQILQTHRFKLGIQQFFIFLVLTWFLDGLISHDKAYLIKTFCNNRVHYGYYLVAVLYMLLIDMPIVIWLFTGLLIEANCSTLTLALWLIGVHSLAPVKYWISHIIQTYTKKSQSTR